MKTPITVSQIVFVSSLIDRALLYKEIFDVAYKIEKKIGKWTPPVEFEITITAKKLNK